MRFVAGTFDAGSNRGSSGCVWRPQDAQRAYDDGTSAAWNAGFAWEEVRRGTAAAGDASVLAVGCCLASAAELTGAADAAANGRWGSVVRLPGSFLAVVRTGSTLRVAGDRSGAVSVYWLTDGDTVLWATAATPLAAYAGASPDLAALLVPAVLRGVDPYGGGSSHFHGVQRVPPGCALVLQPGRRPRTERVPCGVGQRTLADGARVVGEAVVRAVSGRAAVAGRVSADLSGGVDSGTITSLAAHHGPLLAVTYTDSLMGEQDDLRYAERIAAGQPSITHQTVHGEREGVQHFDGLADTTALPFTDTPSLSLGLLAIKRAQLAPVAAFESRAHLTGRGGDDVLDAVAVMLVDQYRAGYRAEALRRTVALARERRSAVHLMLHQAARTRTTSYPQALATLADRLRDRGTLPTAATVQPWEMLTWCGATAAAPWLTRSGRDAVASLVAERADHGDPAATPGQVHERLALEMMGDGHATFDQIARQQWGVPVHAPFLDTAVVDVCHAIPGWERRRPGDFKPLARAAFTGTVPDFLLHRATKTAFTGSVYAGLRANAPTLRRILSGSVLAQAGLLDADQALAALDAAVRGERAPLAALHTLLVAELWLTLLSTSRDTWWEKVPVPDQKKASR